MGGARLLGLVAAVAAMFVLLAPAAPAVAGSADVAAVQVAMSAEELYPHPVDGISGPWTVGAVEAFQASHGLTVDGVAGAQTRQALGRRGRPDLGARPMRIGQRGWDVAALQYLLSSRGFGPGGYDGASAPTQPPPSSAFRALPVWPWTAPRGRRP